VRAAIEAAYADGTWGRYFGPAVPKLEESLRAYHGCEHVLLCGSGTYAVELALRALKVGPGQEVLLSAYDYPGNFLTVAALGASPVLVDLDPKTWQMGVGRIEESIGPRTTVLVVSHLHGGAVPMAEVMRIAAVRGLCVVEDAAQCPGAVIDGKKAGTWGDAGVLSFGGSKLLTAGRGGAVLFRDADDYQRARAYQLRGNLVCPLSELQAAVLLPQVEKLDARTAQRRARVEELRALVKDVPGLRLFDGAGGDHVPGYYKVGFQYDAAAFGLARGLFVRALRGEGIAMDEGFAAAHVGRSARRYRAAVPLTEAERAHAECVVLHHPVLLEGRAEVEEVAEAVRRVYAWREAVGGRE
jgi:dTDP-4-amino-4,6-dideoxygalactose transaminase